MNLGQLRHVYLVPMRALSLLSVVPLVLVALPASASSVEGVFNSPLGKVKVVDLAGIIEARAVRSGGPCNFKKGQVVFEGAQLDDSITGTINACKVGPSCGGKVSGMMVLNVYRGGKLLSGAVHLKTGSCKTPLNKDAVAFKRAKKSRPRKNPKAKDPVKVHVKPKIAAADKAPVFDDDPKPGKRDAAEAKAFEAQGFFELGLIEDARSALKAAVKLDPMYDQGYNLIGVTYRMRDRYDEALDWYKKSIEINPANHDVYYNIACIHALKGDKDQALNYLQIAALNGYVSSETFSTDADLKSLHGNEIFEKLRSGQL